MANSVKLKRSAVAGRVPTTTDLELGQLGVNTYDGKLFLKKDNGTESIVEIGGGGGAGDVVGPASATDNAIARYDGTTGELIQNSTVTISDTGAIAGAESISNLDFAQFDTTVTPTEAVAKLQWDDGNGTFQFGLKGGNANLQVGQEIVARVYNDSGVALSDGQIVYISGSQGNRIAVKLAKADSESTSAGTLGMVTEPIAIGAEGFITMTGTVNKLNTTGLTAGSLVYLSASVAGGYTTTPPTAPNHRVTLGYVERVDNMVGSIYVKVDNGYELDELHNVLITSPTSGNVLIYDAVQGVWENANISAGTGISVTNGAGSVSIANTGVTSVNGNTGAVTATNLLDAIKTVDGAGSGLDADTLDGNSSAYFQQALVSGTNIKTVNGTTLLGSGNLAVGTVTSVAATVPTGLSVSGTPITGAGTLAISYSAGYSIPTTASQGNWDTAYADRNKWDGGSSGLVAATGRTSLGASTLGSNIFTITNPSAVTFPRFNADNTISALTASDFRTAIGAGTGNGNGTVTSVSGTAPISVANGTTTPAITISQATTSANGYLSSTDWNTFNNKQAALVSGTNIKTINSSSILGSGNLAVGTVTSVSGTGTVSGLTLSGTVTGSGSLTLGGTLAVTPAQVSDQNNTSTGYFDLPVGTTAQRPASPANGMVRYNTDESSFEGYQNSQWVKFSATPYPYSVEYLVVAGGGGGGRTAGGGGGAGGYIASSTSVTPSTAYSIVVGAGGAGQTSGVQPSSGNGSNSSGLGSTAIGGGGGAGYNDNGTNKSGASGGSGGGCWSANSGGSGTSGQGNAGGAGKQNGGYYDETGGGGGGASAVGGTAANGGPSGSGGNGSTWLNGTTYAGGGGGGRSNPYAAGSGGTGGGGAGGNTTGGVGSNGSTNTGGGGGGGGGSTAAGNGGAGGSGIVVIRYAGAQRGSGGTVSSAGGYTYHTFTSSGTFTA